MSRRKARRFRPVSVKGGAADIYIDGEIGLDVTAASVREQLAAAKGASELRVHINSIGGVVTEGMAIYSALRGFQGKKVGIVEGIAASMASVLLMACDERIVNKGAYVMIHNPSGGAMGEAKDLHAAGDLLDSMRSELLDIYESRSGIDRVALGEMLDAETYFTAEEAVESGLADRIGGDDASVPVQAVARLNPAKLPEALRALANKEKPRMAKMSEEESKALSSRLAALEEENARLRAELEEKKDSDGEEEKDAEDGDAEDSEDDGDEKHDTHASDDDGDEKREGKALLRDVLRITGTKDFGAARGALMALAHKAGASQRDSRAGAVAKLISEGRLAPAMKSWALKASDKAFGAYVKSVGNTKVAPVGESAGQPAPKGAQSAEPSAAEKHIASLLSVDPTLAAKARGVKYNVGPFAKDEV